jgi:hypothetical protein
LWGCRQGEGERVLEGVSGKQFEHFVGDVAGGEEQVGGRPLLQEADCGRESWVARAEI